MHPPQPMGRGDFEIAIICALRLEADAVEVLFDNFWDGEMYEKAPGDPNAYTTGAIGLQNVTLAHMPGMGKNGAAGLASSYSIEHCTITHRNRMVSENQITNSRDFIPHVMLTPPRIELRGGSPC